MIYIFLFGCVWVFYRLEFNGKFVIMVICLNFDLEKVDRFVFDIIKNIYMFKYGHIVIIVIKHRATFKHIFSTFLVLAAIIL